LQAFCLYFFISGCAPHAISGAELIYTEGSLLDTHDYSAIVGRESPGDRACIFADNGD
jgi:hypothetical protein